MITLLRATWLAFLLASMGAYAEETPDIQPQQCLECHDYGEDSPVHQVLAGSHGISGDEEDMADRRGCLDCHGESASHLRAPRRNPPETSFGPRWTGSSSDQDATCLACHEDNVARNWRHALHMHNNLTCVTCHDIHAEQDKVLFERQQAEVCTTCHKVQKQGIHGMERRAKRNPACSSCHNPHDHESAQSQMLANRSEGCTTCHDLVRMASRDSVSDKAKSYHKVMTNPDRTCMDCHQGVAHAPADSAPPIHPTAVRARTVTLFYPGLTDSRWLTQDHPGSQPLRQGTHCQRCHRGEEAGMGAALSGEDRTPARAVEVAFDKVGDSLRVTLRWESDDDDSQLSLMWGDGSDETFRRGGCFAACHDDLAGMSADRGQVDDKYLLASRLQQRQVGQPALTRSRDELQELLAAGQFAELWQVDLASGSLRSARVLEKIHWDKQKLMDIKLSVEGPQRVIEITRPLGNTETGIRFSSDGRYTLGIALHGADNRGAEHWVSLPMSLSFGGEDTDFTAE